MQKHLYWQKFEVKVDVVTKRENTFEIKYHLIENEGETNVRCSKPKFLLAIFKAMQVIIIIS